MSAENIRKTKRKLDDAFQILDSAVNSTDRPEPPKRSTNTIRSLYSTLAKYGIKTHSSSSQESTILPTPHLTAILSRSASTAKNNVAFDFFSSSDTPAPPLPQTSQYRPSSLSSFLSRLGTYKLSTYSNKPPSIDAVAAAKCGWTNDGKDRLACGLCNASWVVLGREGLGREAANILLEKQRISMIEAHKKGCPWRTRHCDDSIYSIPLRSSGATINDIISCANKMDSVIKNISIKHPLSTSQLRVLGSIISSYPLPPSEAEKDNQEVIEPSETAILTALFGWNLVPQTPEEPVRQTSSRQANLMARSAPPSSPSSPVFPEHALLHCNFCRRRIGLWSFSMHCSVNDSPMQTLSNNRSNTSNGSAPERKKTAPQRSLDILKEHRPYCPYVFRSTLLPSLPIPQACGISSDLSSKGDLTIIAKPATSPMEGWKAILSVVLRYGMARKQRIEHELLSEHVTQQDGVEKMDVDNVKAMVAGVKNRGGKDLLKYVKGLLG